jgi:CRISPR-associated protein Cmr4
MLDVITHLFPADNAWLQIGGNETVGMGWCAVSTTKGA